MRMEPLAYLKEIEVGMRITEEGPSFFGLDEVNKAVRGGESLVEVREGATITTRVGEDAANVQLALTGYSIKIVIAERRVQRGTDDRKHWWKLW